MDREKASRVQEACLDYGDRQPLLALQKDTAGLDRFSVRVRSTHFTQEEMSDLTGLAHRQGLAFDVYGVGQMGVEFRFMESFGA